VLNCEMPGWGRGGRRITARYCGVVLLVWDDGIRWCFARLIV